MNDLDQRKIVVSGKFAALNWLGGGWPRKYRGRRFPDPRQVASRFVNQDTLDIQSGILQFYSIADQFSAQGVDFWNLDSIHVLEIGGGYGRLALFFLAYFGSRCHYVNVDFVPISLAYCYQVIQHVFPGLKILTPFEVGTAKMPIEQYNFVSLPAWEVELLKPIYDLGVNIHSF